MGKKGGNLATILVLALTYFAAAKLGLRFAYVNPSATAVWLPTGISFTAFLILGYRMWPAIFLGAFLANLTTAGSLLTSIAISSGNTLEGVMGCYLVNRFAASRRFFERAPDIFKFAFLREWSAQRSAPRSGSLLLRWRDMRIGRSIASFGVRGGSEMRPAQSW